jgi:hypothetical protein
MAGTGFGGGFGAETGAASGSRGSDDLGPSLSFSTGFLAFTCVAVMLRLSSLADGAKATLRKGMPLSLPVTSSVTVLRPLWLATRARQSLRYVTLKPFPLSKFAASYRLKHLVELLHVVDVASIILALSIMGFPWPCTLGILSLITVS